MNYLNQNYQALLNAFKILKKAPVKSFLSVIISAFTLTIPIIFFLFIITLDSYSNHLFTKNNQILIYLDPKADASSVKDIELSLVKLINPQEISIISKEEGLKELNQLLEFNIKEYFSSNPLPIVLKVSLKPKTDTKNLLANIKKFKNVDDAMFDVKWLEEFNNLLWNMKLIFGVLLILMGAVALFLITHTIQQNIQQNLSKIVLLKQLGASSHYIKKPFLLLGVIYGLLTAFLAICMSYILYNFSLDYLVSSLSYFQIGTFYNFYDLEYMYIILIFNSFLGILSTLWAFKHFNFGLPKK